MCFEIETNRKIVANAKRRKIAYKVVKVEENGDMRGPWNDGLYRFNRITEKDHGPATDGSGTRAYHGIYVWLSKAEALQHIASPFSSRRVLEVLVKPKDFLYTGTNGASTYKRVKPIKFVR